MRRVLESACLLASLLVPASASASQPQSVTGKPAAIVGGEPTTACEWPMVGALTLGGVCTATLVHPRVIVYAAHCGTLHTHVRLGDRSDMPALELPLLRCERASDIFGVSSMDFAYCELREPLEDVPITPLLFGCQDALIEIGTPVTIVGFGEDEGGVVGIKRAAQTQIVGMLSTIAIGGMGVGADKGDSGGPAFVQLDDGTWRVLGIASGGGGDGAAVQYVPAPLTLSWIEQRSGIDISPCHGPAGEWAPTPACGGFHASSSGASWDMCNHSPGGWSGECGDPFSANVADSVGPIVEIVEPAEGLAFELESIELDVVIEADDPAPGWGLRAVMLELDGKPWLDGYLRQARDEVPPFEFSGMQIEGFGAHELVAVAEDWAGNITRTAPIRVELSGGDERGSESGDERSDESGAGDEAASQGCGCRSGRGSGGGGLLLILSVMAIAVARSRSGRREIR